MAMLTLAIGCDHQRPAIGTVSGVVRLYGGPAFFVGGTPTMALNGNPTAGQTVTASRGGKAVATTITDRSGRFSLALPVGDYTVGACGPAAAAAVRSNQTTSVELTCAVP